jgi:hypothetical protein
MPRVVLILVLSVVLLPSSLPAQATGDERDRRLVEVQNQAFEAIDRKDYEAAEKLLREQITLDSDNFVPYYNLACVLSLKGQAAAAGNMLIKAVEHGFTDLRQLQEDPQLENARKDAAYRNLVASWPDIIGQHLDANLRSVRKLFDGKNGAYAESRDEKLRLAYLSAMDATSSEQARKDIARLYDWGIANVFPSLGDADKAKRDAWVVVVLPSQKDFQKWAAVTYGAAAVNNFSGIGGSYLHDQKRLVAQDLGATLRHEFFHVLHWRDMTRRGQMHPIWIQEGLCSLVEDYECPDGTAATLKPVASWRTNISGRLMRAGRLLTISKMAEISRERFTGSSPLAHYGQARTLFLFLSDSGKLKDWYAHYVENFDSDPTGVKAFEAVFGEPIAEVDKQYRQWVRSLPEVAEQIKPGDAGLGVDVDPGTGDGPVIVGIPPSIYGRRNPALRSGLRVGDVITSIDGSPTRDLNELVRLLGTKKVGEEVEVGYRRRSEHGAVRITLQAN